MKINIPVSVGELIDKITILEIKSIKIKEKNKLSAIKKELDLLNIIFKKKKIRRKIVSRDYKRLKAVNLKLWNIEDLKRKYEKQKKFDDKFIKLARNVYLLNDKRAKYKSNINILTHSEIIEVKSY
ncbi:MAG: DUF6165 family protein [Candidatus Pelagibacterales bacterium]